MTYFIPLVSAGQTCCHCGEALRDLACEHNGEVFCSERCAAVDPAEGRNDSRDWSAAGEEVAPCN